MLDIYVAGEVVYVSSSPSRFGNDKHDHFVVLKLWYKPDNYCKDCIAVNIQGTNNRFSITKSDKIFLKNVTLKSYEKKNKQNENCLLATVKATQSQVVFLDESREVHTNTVYGNGIIILPNTFTTFDIYNICVCECISIKYVDKKKTESVMQFEMIWPKDDKNNITDYVRKANKKEIMVIGSLTAIPLSDDKEDKTATVVVYPEEIRVIR